eukprot:Lithocolla_globosa_v1_NODE_650_length_3512_cov_6.191496.p3 type:complete len:121 gc:universal NODE_650_length_3512_cov_6.191496:3271-2909(-)
MVSIVLADVPVSVLTLTGLSSSSFIPPLFLTVPPCSSSSSTPKHQRMEPVLPTGPINIVRATKKIMDQSKLKPTVDIIKMANCLKKVICPPNRNTPAPSVVQAPAMTEIPISVMASRLEP